MYSLLWSIEKLYLCGHTGSVKGVPFILPGVVFLLRDWDNKGVVLRCFEAIATILLICATRPSLSRQKWLSFFKVVKRCPCRALQCCTRAKCAGARLWKQQVDPSNFYQLVLWSFCFFVFLGKSTWVFWIWVIFEVKRCPCSCMRRRRCAGCSRGGLEIGGLVTARPASCKLAPPLPEERFPKETRW